MACGRVAAMRSVNFVLCVTRRVLAGVAVLALALSTMAFAPVDRTAGKARVVPPAAVGSEGAALRTARASGRAVHRRWRPTRYIMSPARPAS